MASHARNRAKLLISLHAAFDQDRLYLAFQPQVDLHTGELIGLEALMRWRSEDGKMVPPDQFIPVAEQSGLIVSLGDWVLQTACVTMRQLLALGAAPRRMAVNVSVVQFQSPGFVERVQLALAVAGLTGSQLELEITESVAMLGAGMVEPILRALREQGISVAIDDFGTGYSSLSYLERLPLDRIKIDKAFVFGLAKDDGPRIAEMIVQLGHKLGLRVLAEGVENEAVWESLKRMGCHEAQGYHIARPMDSDELVAWLTRPRNISPAG
jgi:EAL domain-containing protein (putative c-di-GMP-specific phosphodiesterase class I)